MTTYSTDDKSLSKILEQINSGKLQLPDFQRGWIWDDQHIRDLLVSVAKSFPIGAIMLLETGGETNFQVRPIDGISFNGITPQPEMLILDGQQRLTSLTQALTSEKPVDTINEKKQQIMRYYYIDINLVLDDGNIEDAIIAVDANRQQRKNFGRDIELDLSTVEKECQEFYFPCNQILNSDKWEKNLHDFYRDKFSAYMDFRNLILDKFRHYEIPAIILEKETQKEAVCLVFEKVNTGGVQLTVFELVTASFAAEGTINLRKDWYGDEENEIEGIRDRLYKEPTMCKVEPTEFLQAISLLTTLEQRNNDVNDGKSGKALSAVSAKRSAILSLTCENYETRKSDVETGFLLAAKFLRKQCIFTSRDLPYQTQVVPIASALALLKDKWLENNVYEKICRLFWCGVLGELYSGPVETQMANDLEDLMNWIDDDSKIPRTIRDATFHEDRLFTLKTRTSAAYKGVNSLILREKQIEESSNTQNLNEHELPSENDIVSLIVSEGARDFFWNASIKELDFEEIQIDIHHIFPKKWCKDNFGNFGIELSNCDSIINKTPISYKANRIIGGDAPSKYISKLQQMSNLTDLEMDRILESHGIDPVSLRNDDFQSFFCKRKTYLLKLINYVMGKN